MRKRSKLSSEDLCGKHGEGLPDPDTCRRKFGYYNVYDPG